MSTANVAYLEFLLDRKNHRLMAKNIELAAAKSEKVEGLALMEKHEATPDQIEIAAAEYDEDIGEIQLRIAKIEVKIDVLTKKIKVRQEHP